MLNKLNNFPVNWIKKLIKECSKAEIYLVGGMVRDILIGRDITDVDFVVRNVKPSDLEKFLSSQGEVNFVGKSFGVYKFQPATLRSAFEQKWHNVWFDITIPRTEHSFNTGGYKDVDIKSDYKLEIEKDLERRDFTINAIALKLKIKNNKLMAKIVDPYEGQKDLKNKIIRTVGESEKRFQEDATRILRAIRLVCQLSETDNIFTIDSTLIKAIKKKNSLIKKIAPERISEELNKIIMTSNAELGFRLMGKFGILKIIMPDLAACIGIDQSRGHIYTVYEHSLRSLGFAAKDNYPFEIRWAALLHDLGKVKTRAIQKFSKTERESKIKNSFNAGMVNNVIYTFYNHEKISAGIAKKLLRHLRFSEKQIKKISHLILHHMFYYNIGEITDSAVRRFIRKVGRDNIDNLIKLRIADRLGMGRPKAKPFKLIELERRIKEVSLDPISVLMLKINGADVIKATGLKPSARIGWLMKALLAEILEHPEKNKKEYLLSRLPELNRLSEQKLKKLSPDLDYYEEKRREKYIGKPLIFKGKRLTRMVGKIETLKIRRYQERDNDAVWNLHNLINDKIYDDLKDIKKNYLKKGGEFLVGLIGKKIIATGAFKKTLNGKAKIEKFGIHPDYQLTGYGKALLAELENRAKKNGVKTIILNTSSNQITAQNLYLKQNYIEIKKDKIGTVFYEKELKRD